MTVAAPAASTATLTVARAELAAALRAVGTLKAGYLQLVVGDTVEVRAYAPTTAIATTLDAAATGEASLFLQRRAIASLLPFLDSDIEIQIGADKHGRIRLSSGDTEFWIKAASEAEASYGPAARPRRRSRSRRPSAPPETTDPTRGHDLAVKGRKVTTIEAPTLVEVLRRVLPFASRDETRPVLTYVALYPNRHVIAATDSYRLAVVRWDDDGPAEPPVLMPAAGAASMKTLLGKRLGPVRISQTKTQVIVDFDGLRWSMIKPRPLPTPSKDGRDPSGYPNWDALLPGDAPESVTKVDREDLLAGARAALAVAQHRNEPLRLTLNGKAVITCGTKGETQMTRRLATASTEGIDLEIGVNPRFLADMVAAAPVERLTMKAYAPLRPVLVEAARDVYMLMPIRLNV